VNLVDFDLNFADFTQFQLTTVEGFTYILDQKLGAISVTDLNGNKLTISPNGIIHSSGKSVTFLRDSQNRITQITDPNGAFIQYQYNAAGDLKAVIDRTNLTTSFLYAANHLLTDVVDPRGIEGVKNSYDESGRLISTTDASGHSTTFTHDISVQHEVVSDRLGNPTLYEYDQDGNVVRMTDPLGNVTSFTYDANDNKLTETDSLGKVTSYTYDAVGNRLTETDALGHITTYTYNNFHEVLTVIDPMGHLFTRTYDTNGNLLTRQDPLGNSESYTYNGQGLPTTIKDAQGHITTISYDNTGHITQLTDPTGKSIVLTYDANGNRLNRSTARTKDDGTKETLTTRYEYDADNRLVKTTNASGSSTRNVYNFIGKKSDTFDELGRKTHYEYDDNGRLTTTTYPDGTSESTAYDANDRRLTSKDRAGNITSYTYDSTGRLTTTAYADGSTIQMVYDAAGRITKSIDALGNETQYAYDAAGHRTSITDALGHITRFAYDAAGNQISVTDSLNHTVQSDYDNSNRRVKTTYSDRTTESVSYDALGRELSKIDQAGKILQYGYDVLGRLTSVTQFLNNSPLTTTYAYDEVGNRVSQTDANGHVTSFAYDQLGRRTSRKLPLGMTESYGYDAAGNLTSMQDFNGHTTTYQYDSMNRLTKKTADTFFAQNAIGAAQVSFTYTATGRRISMTDASGTTSYTYDNRDRLLTKATPFGTLTYTYDAAGNALSLKSSNAGGASMTYTYDQLNRVASVTDAAGKTTYSYDAAGNLSGYAYPNGVSTSYAYNSLNQLASMQSTCGSGAGCRSPGAAIASYSYTLSPVGNRLSVAELSGRTVQYSYDDLYRLTSETISGASAQNGTISYQYDAVGNRLKVNSTGAAIPASGLLNYDANDRSGTDVYDNNGNTINNGTQNIYDFENRLVQRGGVALVYDGDGNRVSKTVAGVTTNYLVAEQNLTGYAQVLDELQGGAVTRAYSYGLDLINEQQTISGAPVASFYGYDGHGSVRFLTDSTGAVTDTYDYDAFGNLIASTGSTPNNYLFAGEQFDPALGIYYNRSRYYDQRLGRFWSMDIVEGNTYDPISLHRYLYGSGNPVNKYDPSGLFSVAEEEAVMADEGVVDAAAAAEDQLALTLYKTFFRTSLYIGEELVYSEPSLLVKVIASLTAAAVATAPVFEMLTEASPDQMPDVIASERQRGNNGLLLFRDADSPSPSAFKWNPVKDKDGLSMYEVPRNNKDFAFGFWAFYQGEKVENAKGGFAEPELLGIAVWYTPQHGGPGHWSVIVWQEVAQDYADRFARAAKRIRDNKIPGQFIDNR
jgi:RHS repeat-associated protein